MFLLMLRRNNRQETIGMARGAKGREQLSCPPYGGKRSERLAAGQAIGSLVFFSLAKKEKAHSNSPCERLARGIAMQEEDKGELPVLPLARGAQDNNCLT
jgi:hypothetical protein